MLKQDVACFDYMEPSGLSWWNLKQLARLKLVAYAYNRAHMQVFATVMQKFVAQCETQVFCAAAFRSQITVMTLTQRSQNVAVSRVHLKGLISIPTCLKKKKLCNDLSFLNKFRGSCSLSTCPTCPIIHPDNAKGKVGKVETE